MRIKLPKEIRVNHIRQRYKRMVGERPLSCIGLVMAGEEDVGGVGRAGKAGGEGSVMRYASVRSRL